VALVCDLACVVIAFNPYSLLLCKCETTTCRFVCSFTHAIRILKISVSKHKNINVCISDVL
jgi:hypothetical protein